MGIDSEDCLAFFGSGDLDDGILEILDELAVVLYTLSSRGIMIGETSMPLVRNALSYSNKALFILSSR